MIEICKHPLGVVHCISPSDKDPQIPDRTNPDSFVGKLELAELYGMHTLYLPNPSKFNAEFVATEKYTEMTLSPSVRKDTSVKLMGNVFADGSFVKPGESIGYFTGDCPGIVFSFPTLNIAAIVHAGRDSMMHDVGFLPRVQHRKNLHFNVLQALYTELLLHVTEYKKESNVRSSVGDIYRDALKNLYASIHLGISWESFSHPHDHPVYGEKNALRSKFLRERDPSFSPVTMTIGSHTFSVANQGHIDLKSIILRELEWKGIDIDAQVHIDNIDTGSQHIFDDQTDSFIPNPWASNSRGMKKRNFVGFMCTG